MPTSVYSVSLEESLRLLHLCEGSAASRGLSMTFAVVDPSGLPVALHRMDGATPISVELALKKARTSALFRRPTHQVFELVQPGGRLFGLFYEELCPFGGGFPLEISGQTVGALGVSGGTVAQDVEVGLEAISLWLSKA